MDDEEIMKKIILLVLIVGYITHGITEKIKLKKGSWYKVEGKGKITLYPVKVRIE